MIQLDIIMTKEIIENISDSSFHEMDFKIDEKKKEIEVADSAQEEGKKQLKTSKLSSCNNTKQYKRT